jgi:hypothetical protein
MTPITHKSEKKKPEQQECFGGVFFFWDRQRVTSIKLMIVRQKEKKVVLSLLFPFSRHWEDSLGNEHKRNNSNNNKKKRLGEDYQRVD